MEKKANKKKGKGALASTPLKDLMRAARQHFLNREFNEAEGLLGEVLKTKRNYPDVFNMLGVIWHNKGKLGKALEAFREALLINPNYTEASLNLAVLYNDLCMYKEAREVYAKSQTDPNSPKSPDSFIKGKLANMHADIGDTYMDINMHNEATTEYKKALSLCPTYIDIRTKLGIALREKGDIKGSIEQLKKVKKEKPDYAPARIGLGLAYYSNRQRKSAAKEWHQVLENDPDNERAKMFLRLVDGPTKNKKKPKAKKTPTRKKAPARKKITRKTAKKSSRP